MGLFGGQSINENSFINQQQPETKIEHRTKEEA